MEVNAHSWITNRTVLRVVIISNNPCYDISLVHCWTSSYLSVWQKSFSSELPHFPWIEFCLLAFNSMMHKQQYPTTLWKSPWTDLPPNFRVNIPENLRITSNSQLLLCNLSSRGVGARLLQGKFCTTSPILLNLEEAGYRRWYPNYMDFLPR